MWKWLEGLTGKGRARTEEKTPGPHPTAGPSLLDDLLAQALTRHGGPWRQLNIRFDPGEHAAGRTIFGLDPRAQAELAVEVFLRYLHAARSHNHNAMMMATSLAGPLLRRKPVFQEEQLVRLAEAVRDLGESACMMPVPVFLRTLEDHVREHGLGVHLRATLGTLPDRLARHPNLEQRKVLERLRHLLRHGSPKEPGLDLRRGDAWANTLLDALDAMLPGDAAAWLDLLAHCATATSARPSSKWLSRAKELSGVLAPEGVSRVLTLCLGRVGEPGMRKVQTFMSHQYEIEPTLLDDEQTDLLRGLAWCANLVDDPALTAAVGRAAEACFRKVDGHGPRNAKVGNACLDTLSRLGTPEAVAQLSRLRTRVQHPSSRKQLETLLGKAAERQGLTKAELEEMAVPTLGLTEPGLRRETLGGFTAELRVTGTASTELTWLQQGKPQKSVPKAVKEGHADELKALTAAAREIQKLLPGQRDRLERLYLFPRDWDLATWRERYLDHPLVGTLARRLIWCFGTQTGFWREDRIVDAEEQPLDLPEDTRVSLWHPLDSQADEVLAWRTRLEAWEVVQPFKQAHREIYLLTDAERQTAIYSNRFAAHILKQHQFAALCRQRGWTYGLQGQFDSHNTPFLMIPEHGLRVEFWVDAAGEDASEMAIYLYVATDQVRFCDLAGVPQPLEQVPPLLFSELMRDVDLFVGVCSVGNDPNWTAGGDRPGTGYWREYSFGELGESARTRRELLGRLVPRLKIADRCTLTERFLVVRGERKTYKIHLGSGNILLEPNDQYLCIVADRSPRGAQPVLPFEGDGTLAVILSKAFLLAEDTKITDPQILSQIGR
ncbi:MAG TPA: DUF4132 domain-containing protein [Thermoanaerobaculia bacterium]|nr:DUF4132 domain-containing protein [Thermoanaerobaculia bacterium]